MSDKNLDPTKERNIDRDTSTEKKIDDLYRLIHGIPVCMMTTRCAKTGKLVSRPMSPRPVIGIIHLFKFYVVVNRRHCVMAAQAQFSCRPVVRLQQHDPQIRGAGS